jgi:hypothetical protein
VKISIMSISLIAILLPTSPMARAQAPTTQGPFGLRGDNIGEGLADFRARNHRDDPSEPVIVGMVPQGFPKCSGDLDLSKLPKVPEAGDKDWASKFHAYSKAGFYSIQEKTLDSLAPVYGGDRVCETGTYSAGSIAGASASLNYSFKQGVLDMIAGTFDRENFPQVKTAIVSKYGEPSSVEHHEYKNAAGAVLSGEVDMWNGPGSAIHLAEYSDDLTRSRLRIFAPQTQLQRLRSDQTKANADF